MQKSGLGNHGGCVVFFWLMALTGGCAATPPGQVVCGIDVLARDHFRVLEGRRIALITNQTGRDREGHRDASLLAGAGNFKLVCLLSPEHGLYGNVDKRIDN